MTALSDDALRALLRRDPAAGWRAFIEQYTPLLVAMIRRAGLSDRDEIMDVYVLVCELLSARGFERLRSQDAGRGSIGAWLAVVARHAAIDWLRSKKGRRRLFEAVAALTPFDRRVFELFYWDDRSPSEIAELLADGGSGRATLAAVFESLERVHGVLADRQRAELLALAARSKPPVAIDVSDAAERAEDRQPTPETAMRIAELDRQFETALGRLPTEDAAIVRLKFVEGLTNAATERALAIEGVTNRRVQGILERLRAALVALGVDAGDVTLADGLSLDRRST